MLTAKTISDIVYRLAKEKAKPKALFEQAFADMKKEVEDYAKTKANKAVIALQTTLKTDLDKRGYKNEVVLKVGSFRGHLYVTSAIILINDKMSEGNVNKMTQYLIDNYSKKYKYKGLTEDNKHKFNVR